MAGRDDIDTLLALRDAVAVDLLGRGILQWNPGEVTADDLDGWIQSSSLFAAESDSGLVGSVRVGWSDPDAWGRRPDAAGYVKDLMIGPAERGSGLGLELLGWAESYIGRTGRHWIRLDCASSNLRLCRYYTDAGFRRVESKNLDRALFEKTLEAPAARIG
jgi:protein-tyrosine phosphatase